MCGGAAPDHHCHLARVKVELLASTFVLLDALREASKFYPPLKLRFFCGRHHCALERKELVEMVEKDFFEVEEGGGREGFEIVHHGEW